MPFKKKILILFCLSLLNTVIIADEKHEVIYDIRGLFNEVIRYNPRVNSLLSSIDIAQADKLQATMTYNPRVTFEAENFGGNNESSDGEETEYTLAIQKKIEIAGKRNLRINAADYNLLVVTKEKAIDLLNLLFDTQKAVVNYYFAQKRLELINKRLTLSNEAYKAVEVRVNSAAASNVQLDKMDIERNLIALDKVKAKRAADIARVKLLTLISHDIGDFKIDDDIFNTIPKIHNLPTLLLKAQGSLQYQILQLQIFEEKSKVNLEKAKALEDPDFGIGIRKFGNTSKNAFVAYGSMPISIFNNNKGNIEKANAGLFSAKSRLLEGAKLIEGKIRTGYTNFNAAQKETLRYKTNIIPLTKKVYDRTLSGYNQGRFSELDLIDSQRVFFKMQEEYLIALEDLYKHKSNMDFLLNENIEVLNGVNKLNYKRFKGE